MTETVVQVAVPGHAYEIHIGPGILRQAGPLLASLGLRGKILLVTNTTVAQWHLAPASQSLADAGFEVHEAVLPDGEEYKSLTQANVLYDLAAGARLDRADAVAALGGGVIGDLAGFVAATYMRGLAFVQMPTTVLAQIDSSIGGKVAVNHAAGKNLIGAFHQPRAVFSDPEVLRTLPEREMRQGLIEMLKHGLLAADHFDWYERHLPDLLARSTAALCRGLADTNRIKAEYVAADEREHGARALLNLGHTVGHAFEVASGYGRWRHGEAVGLGLMVTGRLALALGGLTRAEEARLEAAVRTTLGALPDLPEELVEPVLESMLHDKKVLGGRLHFALPQGLGQARVTEEITAAMVRRELLNLAREARS